MEEDEARRELLKEIPDVPAVTNDLSREQLRFIDHRLKKSGVSREFRLQSLRDLDDAGMVIPDFLATMIHGDWQACGDTQQEVEAARKLVMDWSRTYLEQGDEDGFMHGIGFRG